MGIWGVLIQLKNQNCMKQGKRRDWGWNILSRAILWGIGFLWREGFAHLGRRSSEHVAEALRPNGRRSEPTDGRGPPEGRGDVKRTQKVSGGKRLMSHILMFLIFFDR